MPAWENAAELMTKGYAWLPDLRGASGRRTVPIRLTGLRATALEGTSTDVVMVGATGGMPRPERSGAVPEKQP